MKKILIYLLTFVFLFTIFSAVSLRPVSANVTINEVTITPLTENTQAEYKIEMRVGTEINANDAGEHNIYVQFPSEYNLPATMDPSRVTISGGVSFSSHPSAILVGVNNTITLTLQQSILLNQPVFITFSSSAGIVNPVYGVYSIKIWTTAEPAPVTSESFLIAISGGSGIPVSGLTVSVAPVSAGQVADYLLMFNVSGDGALVGGVDYVDVYFPAGTVFPANPDPSKVLLQHLTCDAVEINGLRVRVYVQDSNVVPPYSPCIIEFLEAFGIKNPEAPGDYFVQILTSKDTGIAISNSYQITGTPISNVIVTVTPSSQSTIAEYKVVFNTSAAGSLTANSDTISIVFPNEVTLPASVIPGAITVNDTACVSATVSGNKLIITTPVTISSNSQITVIIAPAFGIKNPDAAGTYSISVYTSADAVRVNANFTITTSQIGQPSVEIFSASAGQVSAYTVSFTTGESGALVSGVDKINIIFPVGTTVPGVIQKYDVTVNGVIATYVTVNVRTVTITVSASTPANSAITVAISENAGIVNPAAAASSYRLNVNTTKETYSVASATYTIYITPATQLTVTPANPDGLNGYYITQPTVTLSASSIADPNPFIYYYFDNNSPAVYSGQTIAVPEGFHMLFYYAVDHQGRQEGIKSRQFMVDTAPPQLVITSPVDNATLNSKDVVVSGSVDVGAAVKVDGQPISVDAAGHFNKIITISGSSAIMTIVATDIAGNSVQEVLHVSLDTTPPALIVISPVSFQEIHKLPVIVRGTTELGATVTVNGNAATVDVSGGFLYGLYEASEGEVSIIQVVAKDAAGNATEKNINIKYIKTTIIKLQVKNAVAMINADTVSLDAPPVIKNGRTLIPVRFISEALGAEITWDPVFQVIDIVLGNDTIRLQIGKSFASVNNKKIAIDTAPIIDHGRTMVPVRFISEALGAEVVWDDATKTVTIIYPKP